MPSSKRDVRNVAAILVVGAFVLQLCFFAPLNSINKNIGEITVRYIDILIIYIILSLALILLLLGLVRLLGARTFLPVLAFLSLVGFLESRFLLGLADHKPFDGSLIDWQVLQWLAWMELAVILALAALFFAFRKHQQLFSTLSLFILLFLAAGFLYQSVSNWGALYPGQSGSDQYKRYFEGFYRLSTQHNVIHIVPDQAQGAMLHDILDGEYERYGHLFDGFTLFTQASGQYTSTYPSVVFYMSGEAPDPEYDLVQKQPYTWEYIDQTLREKSIVGTLARNGYYTYGFQFHPGIFCKGQYTACTGTHDEVFGGGAIQSPGRRLANAITTGLDMGLFQLSPVFLRERVFGDGRWLLRRLSKGAPTHSGILDLFMRDMQVTESPGTYNYFHHAGAHAPLLFDRDCNNTTPRKVNQENQREQVHCTLTQLAELVKVLKDKQLYDQSMIVVNGDHGSPWLPDGYTDKAGAAVAESLMGMASTLLLVKPPGAHGPLKFSKAPASIGDVSATVATALGFSTEHAGIALFDIPVAMERERLFYDYEQSSRTHLLQALPNLKRYRIHGDVFDEKSWLLPNTESAAEVVNGHVSQMHMDHPDFMAFAHGFSLLEQQQTPVRWVDGTKAGIELLVPDTGSMMLVFETYVPPALPGQWMEVAVQGKVIARLEADELKQRQHAIMLGDGMPRGEVVEVAFTLGKSFRPERDRRHLSILFSFVGLVPAG